MILAKAHHVFRYTLCFRINTSSEIRQYYTRYLLVCINYIDFRGGQHNLPYVLCNVVCFGLVLIFKWDLKAQVGMCLCGHCRVVLLCAELLRRMRRRMIRRENTRAEGPEAVPSMGVIHQWDSLMSPSPCLLMFPPLKPVTWIVRVVIQAPLLLHTIWLQCKSLTKLLWTPILQTFGSLLIWFLILQRYCAFGRNQEGK